MQYKLARNPEPDSFQNHAVSTSLVSPQKLDRNLSDICGTSLRVCDNVIEQLLHVLGRCIKVKKCPALDCSLSLSLKPSCLTSQQGIMRARFTGIPLYKVTYSKLIPLLIAGLIQTKVPVNMLLYRPFDPSSFAIHEAFQRGFINPMTLAVRHPATGQFMSLESALTTGQFVVYIMQYIYLLKSPILH